MALNEVGVLGEPKGLTIHSKFTPIDLQNIIAWWRADSQISLRNPGGFVASWLDQIGSVSAANLIESVQPTQITGSHSQKVIKFDEARPDKLIGAFAATKDMPLSVVVIAKFDHLNQPGPSNNDTLVQFGQAGGTGKKFQISRFQNSVDDIYTSNGSGFPVGDDLVGQTWNMITMRVFAGSPFNDAFVDGVDWNLGVSILLSDIEENFIFGSDVMGQALEGEIAEIIYVQEKLTSANHNLIGAYANARYNNLNYVAI